MTEDEWRNLGFELPSGWTHCGKLRPERMHNFYKYILYILISCLFIYIYINWILPHLTH